MAQFAQKKLQRLVWVVNAYIIGTGILLEGGRWHQTGFSQIFLVLWMWMTFLWSLLKEYLILSAERRGGIFLIFSVEALVEKNNSLDFIPLTMKLKKIFIKIFLHIFTVPQSSLPSDGLPAWTERKISILLSEIGQ